MLVVIVAFHAVVVEKQWNSLNRWLKAMTFKLLSSVIMAFSGLLLGMQVLFLCSFSLESMHNFPLSNHQKKVSCTLFRFVISDPVNSVHWSLCIMWYALFLLQSSGIRRKWKWNNCLMHKYSVEKLFTLHDQRFNSAIVHDHTIYDYSHIPKYDYI